MASIHFPKILKLGMPEDIYMPSSQTAMTASHPMGGNNLHRGVLRRFAGIDGNSGWSGSPQKPIADTFVNRTACVAYLLGEAYA